MSPLDDNVFAPPSADEATQRPVGLASPGLRLTARIVDNILWYGVFLVAVFGASAVAAALGSEGDASTPRYSIGVLAVLVDSSVQWGLIVYRGQSVGKILTRIRIERTDGEPVDFLHGIVLRIWSVGCVDIVVSFTGLWGAATFVDALFIFGRDHRTLHDRFADTRVVNTIARPKSG